MKSPIVIEGERNKSEEADSRSTRQGLFMWQNQHGGAIFTRLEKATKTKVWGTLVYVGDIGNKSCLSWLLIIRNQLQVNRGSTSENGASSPEKTGRTWRESNPHSQVGLGGHREYHPLMKNGKSQAGSLWLKLWEGRVLEGHAGSRGRELQQDIKQNANGHMTIGVLRAGSV